MRKYIRHPSDIPIEIDQQDGESVLSAEGLVNVSLGGLSFKSKENLKLGSMLKLKIPLVNPPFETVGRVVWCEKSEQSFEIGVELLDHDAAFRTRMVEQICHIEHYKREVLNEEGRVLSGKDAAMEWIAKFADSFPKIDELETF